MRSGGTFCHRLLGVAVHDHLIIGRDRHISLRELGEIETKAAVGCGLRWPRAITALKCLKRGSANGCLVGAHKTSLCGKPN